MMHNQVKPSSSPYSYSPPMSVSGIHGQLLEVTVVGCSKLKDTEWISKQDPYVCLEYASTKHRTRTHTDGGKNPTFQEKFVFTLIEGLRELSVVVWNSNTLTLDDFIGSGKIQLQKVLSGGYDDSAWALQDKRGRYAGEVRLIMHYANATKPAKPQATPTPSAPPYTGYTAPQAPLYSAPPPSMPPYPPTSFATASLLPSTSFTSSLVPSYPPNSSGYPPHPAAYPPTSTYPPNPTYPPPPRDPYYYPPGSYPQSPYPPPSY